ncbi:hypothetical protein BKA00_006502 [Actinomadura coerulea]|uniref:Uncharacterized protein n=1 Tax=Actinomadura coerulea TaxID=46159 RepID=A0A7X0L2F8_9ACTN|nr:hypothetical protein [Actinomadura coerulea]MBB6399588.1 hypothetical protein [Actinomadura coerulea]GGQ12681.1 hypothetical protein GCM10010187_31130 [Actinomadura coerulea]
MRCPNCGTDSASSSPRCAQCDAPLVPPGADDATALDSAARAGDAGSRDQTSRDPFGPPPGARTPDADDATVQDHPYGAPYSAPYGGSAMGGPPPAGNPSDTDDATVQDDPYRSLYGGSPMGGTPPGGNPPDADDPTIQGGPYGSAPYGGAPYGAAPYGGGAPGGSTPGGVPVPRDPVPPPWGDQNPVQWEPRPDHTLNMPPAEERTTHLSPEPWAAEPWSEPAIWQPPAPPKRSTMPYFLGAAGVVLLIGVALGIVFWPSGSDKPPPAASGPSTGQSQGVASASDSPASGGDLDAQAAAVNGLLEEMGGTRSDLGTVVTQGCPVSGVRRVLDARRGELEKARGLEVGALLDGEEMKAALVRALEASTESNRRYLERAPGCPSESEVADVNQRASSAKSEFIGYWNVVAEKAGLPTRAESDI